MPTGSQPGSNARIGVIADTHSLMRTEALQALEGSNQIIHAGDVGRQEVLQALQSIAPVAAVRGNIDREVWALALPRTRVVEAAGFLLYVLHDVQDLDLDPAAAGFHAVISGHSHLPSIEHRRGVLYLNPGSAGPQRFRMPITLARIHIRQGKLEAELVDLEEGAGG